MAEKKLIFSTEIDNTKSLKSINDMEKDLTAMKNTLKGISDTGSKEFKALSNEILQADGKLKSLNKSFEGMDPEKRAGEFGKLAGGLGAVGTAAALAFANNEKADEFFKTFAVGLSITNAVKGSIETYTSAMALMKDQTILADISQKALSISQYLYTTAVGTSTGALKTFRLALISTGIGAVVVAIGLLIANFEEVSGAIQDAADWFMSLGPAMDFILQPIRDIIAAYDILIAKLQQWGLIESEQSKAARTGNQQRLDELDVLMAQKGIQFDHEQDFLERGTKAQFEHSQARQKVLLSDHKLRIDLIKQQATLDGKFTEDQQKMLEVSTKAIQDARHQLKLNEYQFHKDQQKLADDAAKKRADGIEKAGKEQEEIQKKFDEAAKKVIEDQFSLQDELFASNQARILSESEFEIQELIRKNEEKLLIAKGNVELENEILRQQKLDIQAIEDEAAQKKLDSIAAQSIKTNELKLALKEANGQALSDNPTSEELLTYYEQQDQIEADRFALELETLAARKGEENLTKEQYELEEDIIVAKHSSKRKSLAKDQADYEKKLSELKIQNSADAATNMLGNISSLAAEGSGLSKAAGVAQATIDTYGAAVAAYKAGSSVGGPAGVVMGPLAASLAVAAGVANVQRIVNTKIPGGGGTAPTGGGTSTSIPSFPIAAPTPEQQRNLFGSGEDGNSNSGTGQGLRQNVIRAYVVESDITNTQNTISAIERRSEIGV